MLSHEGYRKKGQNKEVNIIKNKIRYKMRKRRGMRCKYNKVPENRKGRKKKESQNSQNANDSKAENPPRSKSED